MKYQEDTTKWDRVFTSYFGSIQSNTTWTSPNVQNSDSALFSAQQAKKMFKFEEQFFYLLIIKNYEQF